MSKYNNPWLALSTYEEEDCDKFKGREDDAVNMVTLLQQNEYVVCYAASGDGKSSLINAGVCPKIRKMGMFPIKISITTDDEKELNKAFSIDEKELEKTVSVLDKLLIKKIDARLEEYKTKFITSHEIKKEDFEISFRKMNEYQATVQSDIPWWKLRTEAIHVSLKEFGEFDYIPVLIFDQFENVLRTSWKARFFEWLEELSRDICPDRIITTSDVNQDNLPNRKLFKMLFSMRYEYVGELDYWCSQRNYIPQLMRNRYFLKPLSREQAIAIINEQGEKNDPISNKLKQEGENIVDRIISSASSDYSINNEVPAIMLSLTCHVYYEGIKHNSNPSINDLDALIYDFYLDQLSKLNMPDEDRIVLETALLSSRGTRARIPTSDPRLQKIGINNYIERNFNLFSTRLFNHEEIGKDDNGAKEFYIEFVHDKLAEAIQKNKTKNRIPIDTKKKLLYLVILLALTVTCGILCYVSIAPKNSSRDNTIIQNDNPIQLTIDEIDSFDNKDYYHATSITLDRKGTCPHKADCYKNVLFYSINTTNYHVQYAHNAPVISFLYLLPLDNTLHFGPNTEEVFLLPEYTEQLLDILSITCDNKNTIIYVPYGYRDDCLSNKAFSNVCVKELSALSTISKRLLFGFHIEHGHIAGQKGLTIPYWLQNIWAFLFLYFFIQYIPSYKALRKQKKQRAIILIIVCFVITSIASLATHQRWPKLFDFNNKDFYLLISFIATLLLSLLLLRIENLKQRKDHVFSQQEKFNKAETLCCIIYNSVEHKPYAIALKKALIQNGLTESDIKLDLNIANETGFNLKIAQTLELTCKNAVVILEENPLLINNQNKEYLDLICGWRFLHPVFIKTENLDHLFIPKKLKPIITTRSSGTIKSFQSMTYNPDTTEPTSIKRLIDSLKQQRPTARKKAIWGTMIIYILWLTTIELTIFNDWPDVVILNASFFAIAMGAIIWLYYSARIDFPRLKKWKDKMDEKEKAKEEKRKAKRELRKKRDTLDN